MGRNILVVEDDKNISDLIHMYLVKEGFDVRIAGDGGKALEEFQKKEPDLILLDIMLPVMDGWAVCAKIRETSKVPIIMLTAKSEVFDRIQGLEMGADDYIVKPFDVLTLMVRIEKVLKRTGRLNTVYRVRDIELNSETRVVTKAGRAVELQPLEFDVLLTLLKNKNLTVSREQLLSEVWGYEYAGETRAVDMKISNLRKKLNLGDAIRAIPKLGYRLEER